MTYKITHIQITSEKPQLHTIYNYYFVGEHGEGSSWQNKPAATDYVRKNPNTVRVYGGGTWAWVDVVENSGHPYLKTRGDGTTSDNLLALPVVK